MQRLGSCLGVACKAHRSAAWDQLPLIHTPATGQVSHDAGPGRQLLPGRGVCCHPQEEDRDMEGAHIKSWLRGQLWLRGRLWLRGLRGCTVADLFHCEAWSCTPQAARQASVGLGLECDPSWTWLNSTRRLTSAQLRLRNQPL